MTISETPESQRAENTPQIVLDPQYASPPETASAAPYQPPSTADYYAAPQPTSGGMDTPGIMAIISLVISVINLCLFTAIPFCGLPISIATAVMSAIGMKSTSGKTLGVIGLILSIIEILISLVLGIFFLLAFLADASSMS